MQVDAKAASVDVAKGCVGDASIRILPACMRGKRRKQGIGGIVTVENRRAEWNEPALDAKRGRRSGNQDQVVGALFDSGSQPRGQPVAGRRTRGSRVQVVHECVQVRRIDRHASPPIVTAPAAAPGTWSVSARHLEASVPGTLGRECPAPWSVSAKHPWALVPSTLKRQFPANGSFRNLTSGATWRITSRMPG